MNRRLGWVVTGTLSVVFAASAVAGEKAEKKADKAEGGWVELFNGKDLTGWKVSEKGLWKVEDGQIVANGPRSHLFSEQEFQDFHLRAEIMTTPGSNSGVYFHTKFQEQNWPDVGHEAQVNCSHKDPVKTGSLYNVVKVFDCPHKDGEWFTYDIKVKGKRVVIQVNGQTTVDYTEPEDVQGGRKLSSGVIALQAHDPQSVVYYRSVKIRPLAP